MKIYLPLTLLCQGTGAAIWKTPVPKGVRNGDGGMLPANNCTFCADRGVLSPFSPISRFVHAMFATSGGSVSCVRLRRPSNDPQYVPIAGRREWPQNAKSPPRGDSHKMHYGNSGSGRASSPRKISRRTGRASARRNPNPSFGLCRSPESPSPCPRCRDAPRACRCSRNVAGTAPR